MTLTLLNAFGFGLALGGAILTLVAVRLPPVVQHWSVEKYIYRHHFVSGLVITIGSIILAVALAGISLPDAVFRGGFWRVGLWAIICGWVFACFAMVVGLAVTFRPSILKRFEKWANRAINITPDANFPASLGMGIVLLLTGFGVILALRQQTGLNF